MYIAGRIEPIAGQLIEFGKRGLSNDNISVIVVFFKDPKQIISEYTYRKSVADCNPDMDFESSTNGCHIGEASTPSPDHLNIDEYNTLVTMPIDLKASNEHSGFIFGNPGGNFTTTETTTITVTKSNGDGNRSSTGFDESEHDDLGPETDVDATDEAAISPLSPQQQSELINDFNADGQFGNEFHHFVEKTEQVIGNVVQNPFDLVDDIVKKSENDVQENNPFEDNRFLENVTGGSEFVEALARHKIDFSEKKEYSFEREDYEKELDPLGDVPAELIAISKEAAVLDDDDDDDDEEDRENDLNKQHPSHIEVITTEQHGEFTLIFIHLEC